MLIQTLSVLSRAHAVTATGADPSPPPVWALPVLAAAAAFCWYMHWRWKTGRYFMSRFTTAKREKAKSVWYGPGQLPTAIGLTAMTVMFAIWEFWGVPANAWSAYLFLGLAAVFMCAGGWAFKEWFWPSERRKPPWARDM
jgi:hypothetical protein